ncbi:hypothetical protein D3227_37415 [Mesorhizobium waimense]|uniref:Uncharacterized protein n=1 Tax=Mesorhizobium waimense TaxID=1300307 RepID=A0A3A5JTU1_9HYPH|nr:hypothetical protein D3227_37415 [Mesorhizobium waimense]
MCFRGKTIEGLGHDSLVVIDDEVFPKMQMRGALEAIRKCRERGAPADQKNQSFIDGPARGERRSYTPSQNSQSLIERAVRADVALQRLKPDIAQNYAAAFGKIALADGIAAGCVSYEPSVERLSFLGRAAEHLAGSSVVLEWGSCDRTTASLDSPVNYS